MTITAWAATTGETGMRTQARGLARAVADVVVEKTVRGGWAWPSTAKAGVDSLAPPYPDIMITCGRRAAPYGIAVKRASGGRTLIVHVQDPRARRGAFDLIVAMAHDPVAAGGNVVAVATALHDVTASSLAAVGQTWRARFAGLPRPLTGVVIGGDVKGRRWRPRDTQALIDALAKSRTVGGLAITPSRRTPNAARAALVDAFVGDRGVYVWDGAGDNPYRALLALSDRLIVTGDSVSMISEAVSTSAPVEVIDLNLARYRRFIDGLIETGRVRRFTGDPAPWIATDPIDATPAVALAVRALLQRRTGVRG